MDDPDDIRGWLRIDRTTTTSGKLTPGDPARLAAIGVARVINLALDDSPDALPDECGRMADAGIAYTHIPVPFDDPQEAHYAAFKDALERGEGPVHVHCIMNWRVSAFFYRLHRERGMDAGEATALLHRVWAPDESDDPRALPWARFVGRAKE
jgi:uncharacterized protein (TIGR01244 family)